MFVRQLGIERVQALVQDTPWTLTGELLARVETDASGDEVLLVDERVLRRLQEEESVEPRTAHGLPNSRPKMLRWLAIPSCCAGR